MSLFGKNKNKTVDLTGKYDRQKEKMENIRGLVSKADTAMKNPQSLSKPIYQPSQPSSQGSFSFLKDMASSSFQEQTPSYSASSENENSEEWKRKLAKRLADLTEKLEDLSTQIYHLQQRVELLERKTKSTGFE